MLCKALTQCHQPGSCTSGVCSTPLKAVGSPCDDGDVTTGADACTATGKCVGIDKCLGVVCTALDQCHNQGVCLLGTCTQPNKADSTPCDDGNAATDFDVCVDGQCLGEDLCLETTCPEPAACRLNGVCANGRCSYANEDEGTPCNDGMFCTWPCASQLPPCTCRHRPTTTSSPRTYTHPRVCSSKKARLLIANNRALTSCTTDRIVTDAGVEATDNDACSADGECVGVDFCDGVTCIAASDCHSIGPCSHGECPESVVLVDGTSCDDGNEQTVQDTCTAGACAGLDLCAGVVCTAASQCHEAGVCDFATGKCGNPEKPVGSQW